MLVFVHVCSYHCFFFFFNDTATTEIYTLSLHDALPISRNRAGKGHGRRDDVRLDEPRGPGQDGRARPRRLLQPLAQQAVRSEEHTSELQSRPHLVCRLLLEKKKNYDRSSMSTLQYGRAS